MTSKQLQVRVSDVLLRRIDDYTKRARKGHGRLKLSKGSEEAFLVWHGRLTRSDAIRLLITFALDQEER